MNINLANLAIPTHDLSRNFVSSQKVWDKPYESCRNIGLRVLYAQGDRECYAASVIYYC
jgi:hypothetical protein